MNKQDEKLVDEFDEVYAKMYQTAAHANAAAMLTCVFMLVKYNQPAPLLDPSVVSHEHTKEE